jgi:hypothetical protein
MLPFVIIFFVCIMLLCLNYARGTRLVAVCTKLIRLPKTMVMALVLLIVKLVSNMSEWVGSWRGKKSLEGVQTQPTNRPSMPCDVCDWICPQRGTGICDKSVIGVE